MTSVRFLPEAEVELLREVSYYAEARQGTGMRFQLAVEAAVARALHQPQGGAPCLLGTRTMLVKGFPFSVVYRSAAEELLVVAIAPHRKRPHYWAQRLE